MATEAGAVEINEGNIVADAENDSDGVSKQKRGWLRRRSKKKDGEKEKSRKPPDNKWLQQQIPACRPVFSAKHVFFLFVIVGVIFIILGIVFLVATVGLHEVEVEYTDCGPGRADESPVKNFTSCEEYLESIEDFNNTARAGLEDCHCEINFTVPDTLRHPWYMYYSLGNYFQNHRRYVNSWDYEQLRGEGFRSPSDDCRPIRSVGGDDVVPCGLIANSWFNDSFDVITSLDNPNASISCCDRTDIAWDSDRDVRFRNPGGASNVRDSDLDGTTMPPNWPFNLTMIDGGLENESLIVWFRVSAFPVFRKLYGRVVINNSTDFDLPKGDYSISLTYIDYPVGRFGGRKYIVLAEVSWLGGKNLFLGIAYLVTGVLAVIAGVVLLIIHLCCSRWKTTDKDFLNRKY